MNPYIVLAIMLIGFLVLRTFNGTAGMMKISPLDAKKLLETKNGTILLDVRTKSEYLEKHIPNSILIPLDILAEKASKKLPDKDREIIVYCLSGSRSAVAVKTLLKLGYTQVYNLGGIGRWPYGTVAGDK